MISAMEYAAHFKSDPPVVGNAKLAVVLAEEVHRLRALLSSRAAAPVLTGEGLKPMSEAPKDGTAILAYYGHTYPEIPRSPWDKDWVVISWCDNAFKDNKAWRDNNGTELIEPKGWLLLSGVAALRTLLSGTPVAAQGEVVAWMRPQADESDISVMSARDKEFYGNGEGREVGGLYADNHTIPLYAHPSPALSEGVTEAAQGLIDVLSAEAFVTGSGLDAEDTIEAIRLKAALSRLSPAPTLKTTEDK